MLQRTIHLPVPLSQLAYDTSGIVFSWNQARLMIPYDQLQLKPGIPLLLDVVKAAFEGDLTISLQCHLITGIVRKAEVDLESRAARELGQAVSRVEQLADEIRSLAAGQSLTLGEARRVSTQLGFGCTDDQIHTILTEIIDHMPPQQKEEKLAAPLSQLQFDEDGVTFYRDPIRIHTLKVNPPFEVRFILETIQDRLTGDVSFCLHRCYMLKWDRNTASLLVGQRAMEVADVQIDPEAAKGLAGIISRVEQFADEIRSLAAGQSLTLEDAQRVSTQLGFNCTDDQIHRILTEIVDHMPPQQREEELAVPLSQLQFDKDGVTFYHDRIRLHVLQDKLPFEVRPIFETIQDRLTGNIGFSLHCCQALKWDRDAVSLLVEQAVEATSAQIDPETRQAFKRMRCERVCQKIMESDDQAIDRIENWLREWGLDPSDKEVGQQITSTIPAWTEERDYLIPLSQIWFYDSWIVVSLEGQTFRLTKLPFRTSAALEKIKDILEGKVSIHLSQTFRFAWDEQRPRLFVKSENVQAKTSVDQETAEELDKIYALYVELLGKIEPFKATDFIRIGPKRVTSVPSDFPVEERYDRECIRFLEQEASDVYITHEDLWFHIGDALVWERPTYGAATYIFDWPGEKELRYFIGRIWVSRLIDIQRDRECGYQSSVIHVPDDISQWQRHLVDRLPRKTE